MTTATHDREPRFATLADLEALEGRLINRITETELRLERSIAGHNQWTIGLILGAYALIIAAGIAVFNQLVSVQTQLAAVQASLAQVVRP